MIKPISFRFQLLCFLILIFSGSVYSQLEGKVAEGLELSEDEGIPVIIKHLPDWETKRNEAIFIRNEIELLNALGEKPVFSAVDFIADTEAVTANYPEGTLLIVEYGTPQASVDTDKNIKQLLADSPQTPPVFYKRIGNYSVFLFDGKNEAAANTLFDKIKYEKVVRWLSYDPFAQQRAERGFIQETRDIFVATVLWIILGLLIAITLGLISGLLFYQFRQRQRTGFDAFSDGGGLTRLNLDNLTPDIAPGSFLED